MKFPAGTVVPTHEKTERLNWIRTEFDVLSILVQTSWRKGPKKNPYNNTMIH